MFYSKRIFLLTLIYIKSICILYKIFILKNIFLFLFQKNDSDFKDLFKTFGRSVPALTDLYLMEKDSFYNFEKDIEYTELLKPYFPKIKILVL